MGVLWNPTIVNGAFPFIFPLPCQVLTINGHLPSTTICSSWTTLAGAVALAAIGSCQITKVSDFSAGPTKVGMYVHVPKTLKSPAPIIVAVHHCQGSAQQYSTETKYMPLADQHGFILIYPNSKSSGGCFDVASTASMSSPIL